LLGGGTKPPDPPEPEPGNPLDGLKLGQLFTVPYALTSGFNAVRDYGKHEGADYDVIGTNPNSKELVLCVYDGTVERSHGFHRRLWQIRARHPHPQRPSVLHPLLPPRHPRGAQVGQAIKAGQPVGEIGTSGNVSGEHVHFNLEVPGFGLSGYVVADVVDPVPYLPKPITQPPAATGPARMGLHASADPGDLFGGEDGVCRVRHAVSPGHQGVECDQ
jgi:murein DD-endopeptidase MepM/ murein hydrolase activator NlpD